MGPTAKKRLYLLNDQYRQQWNLMPDGAAFFSYSSLLQPVLFEHKKAMLKISLEKEEQRGGAIMQEWQGNGAATVYCYSGEALLLERITGHLSLKNMAQTGADDEATRIICRTAARLHASHHRPLPQFIDLQDWFAALLNAPELHGNRFKEISGLAATLLATTTEKTILHGDLHHENILYSAERGWLVIDPKGLYGNRAFEYANLFCNPDAATALAPGRMEQQLKIVHQETGIPLQTLLQWIAAWTALSGIWMLEDDQDPGNTFAVHQKAWALLNN